MKKIIIATISLIIFSLPANAKKSRIYIGADLLHVQAEHQYIANVQATSTQPNNRSASSSNQAIGLSTGYKASLKRFYVAPELFLDYLNSSTPDFYAPESQNGDQLSFSQDELAIDYRFGFRMNFGYNIYRDINVFVNAGMAATKYIIRFKHESDNNNRVSNGGIDKTPIIGGGITYDITKHLALKLAYDYQKIQATYVFKGLVDEMKIYTTRLGVQYYF